MKTAISVPDPVFARVEEAAGQLGVSRSEFFRRAAERYLTELDDDTTTSEIDAAIAGSGPEDSAFVNRAAEARARDESSA